MFHRRQPESTIIAVSFYLSPRTISGCSSSRRIWTRKWKEHQRGIKCCRVGGHARERVGKECGEAWYSFSESCCLSSYSELAMQDWEMVYTAFGEPQRLLEWSQFPNTRFMKWQSTSPFCRRPLLFRKQLNNRRKLKRWSMHRKHSIILMWEYFKSILMVHTFFPKFHWPGMWLVWKKNNLLPMLKYLISILIIFKFFSSILGYILE